MALFTRKSPEPKPGHEHHPDFPGNTGLHYLDVIDRIAEIRKPDWYLEIGSRSGTSIARRSCNFVAVDPEFAIKAEVFNSARQMHFMQMTSDDFFASGFLKGAGIVPDLCFIDGMHLFEFALRDFINAEKAMRPDGIICFHDVSPFNYAMTSRDADEVLSRKAPWTGDVWKTIDILAKYRPDLQIDVLAAKKTGLACVTRLDPTSTVLEDRMDALLADYTDLSLEVHGAAAYHATCPLRDPEAYLRDLQGA